MRIATLNIRQGGGSRTLQLTELLQSFEADVLVLTEFQENNNSIAFRKSLFKAGYLWQASNSLLPKNNSVFVASKIPFTPTVPSNLPEEFSHRLILAKFKDLNLAAVYFPQREEKRALFDYLNENLISMLGDYGCIIGDFNTGKPFIDEKGKTFSCIDCFEQLERNGLIDSWRSRSFDVKEFSWYSSHGNGFRIDHVFSTPKLNEKITEIFYHHTSRETKASDHSALLMDLANEQN